MALALAALLPTAVRADPDDELARAKQLVADGAKAYRAGQYAEALERFQAAQTVRPSPRLLFNIGQCRLQLGEGALAATAFDRFLLETAADPTVPEANRRTAQQNLDALAPTLVKVTLAVEPATARVEVDGQRASTGVLYVTAGAPHQITAEAPGFMRGTRQLAPTAPGAITVALRLEPSDGATSVRASASTSSGPGVAHVAAIVAFGAAAALAAGGVVVGLSARSKAGEVPASCSANAGPGCSGYDDWHATARLADVLWIGAGTAAAAGGALWVLAPSPDGRGAEVAIAGRF